MGALQGTTAVLDWIKFRKLRKGDPIITKAQTGAKKAPISPHTISRIVRRVTGRPDVSSHSTRVGGVQDALTLGCDMASIMVAGRWTSPEMPARYGRRLLASRSAAAMVVNAVEQETATMIEQKSREQEKASSEPQPDGDQSIAR